MEEDIIWAKCNNSNSGYNLCLLDFKKPDTLKLVTKSVLSFIICISYRVTGEKKALNPYFKRLSFLQIAVFLF